MLELNEINLSIHSNFKHTIKLLNWTLLRD